jgi:hypothetical protein
LGKVSIVKIVAGEGHIIIPVSARFDVTSVGLFLCPNRNLTTLTAAILSLHPHVQVLNHGFERLQAAGLLRFLHSNRDDDLEAFVRSAIGMSGNGRRGDYGGSILLSHAYDKPALRAAYAQRYADAPLKSETTCLIWKDGARLREYLKSNNIDPVVLAERLPRLHFISPLREPVAHLRSLQKYYAPEPPDYIRPSLPDLTAKNVARYILAAHNEFLHWRERNPTQFFAFSQNDLSMDAARRLLGFLQIASDQAWEQVASEFFVNDSVYTYGAGLRPLFESLLRTEYAQSQIASMDLLRL